MEPHPPQKKKTKKKLKTTEVSSFLQDKLVHYENTPIQMYWKFYHPKEWKFVDKKSDIFHISAQNIDCGYSLEPPRRVPTIYVFWAEIRKIMYTAVNLSFTI